MNIDDFIRGTSRIVCLIGYPVEHSISPIIHNHAFRNLNLPYCYIPLSVPMASVHTAISLFRSARFAGANITIPHKSAIPHYCDYLSPLSITTMTVNTLYWEGNSLCGTTTDFEGFTRALAESGHQMDGSDVIILGNGGAARTIAIALALERKIATLTIVGRNCIKIDSLAQEVIGATGFKVESIESTSPLLAEKTAQCTLVVNCTNVGMYPHVEATPLPKHFLHKDMTVFDAVYNPSKTKLLRDAEKIGCRTENGLRMLLFQGLASFRYWTGITPEKDLFPLDMLQSLIERR